MSRRLKYDPKVRTLDLGDDRMVPKQKNIKAARTIKVDTIRRACAIGNKLACQLSLRIAPQIFGGAHISFSGVDLEDENPNKMPFTGVLLLVDVPSTKPPHGSRGHRILVPRAVAKKRLSGLIGMGLNYEPSLESHAPRRKVGVITEAWLDEDKVRVKGFVYKKDFPEVENDFKRGRLGMSMELANVYVEQEKAEIWKLEDFHFTGATVLKKDAAAYYQTALAAKASKAYVLRGQGDDVMDKVTKDKQRKVRASGVSEDKLVKALTASFAGAMEPLTEGIQAQGEALSGLREEMQDMKQLFQLSAAAAREDDDIDAAKEDEDDDDDDDMEARREDDEDDDDDDDDEMAAARNDVSDNEQDDASDNEQDGDDDDEMRAMEDLEEDPADEEPGELNKKRGNKNKGSKKTVTDPPTQGKKFSRSISEGRLSSAAMKAKKMRASKPFLGLKSSASIEAAASYIGDLKAQNRQLRLEGRKRDIRATKLEKKLRNISTRYQTMEAQLERYAESEDRRSQLSSDVVNLLAKSNLDGREMQAAGQTLRPDQVDVVFENSGLALDPTMRMTLKNKFLEYGLMDQGEVRRN